MSSYQDYSVDTIKVGATLPNLNSSVTYTAYITCNGNVSMWVDSIEILQNNNSNMTFSYSGITIKKDFISQGETKKVDITIKYNSGISLPSNKNVDMIIKFKFSMPKSVLTEGSNSATSKFFNSSLCPIKKESVEKITFLPTLKVGDNIGSWDASKEKNGTVVAWYTDNDGNGLYELNIGGAGKVYFPENSRYLFGYFTNLKSISFGEEIENKYVSYVDSSEVTNMYMLFYQSKNVENLDLRGFNTSKVENIGYMFRGCSAVKTIDLSTASTSSVTNAENLFSECTSLTNVTFGSDFTLSKVSSLLSMFNSCSSLISVDLSTLNVSNITSIGSMFDGCTSLTNINFGNNFNTTNVSNMSYLFRNCKSLTSLDIRNLDFNDSVDCLGIFVNVSKTIPIYVNESGYNKLSKSMNLIKV